MPDETKSHASRLMWQLAGASRQVPKSYLVGTWTRLIRYKVKSKPIANGGFADIRAGKLRGMVVVVKTIRISPRADVGAIHKVRRVAGCPILVIRLTRHTESRTSVRNASSG